jgi:hypothetical protein
MRGDPRASPSVPCCGTSDDIDIRNHLYFCEREPSPCRVATQSFNDGPYKRDYIRCLVLASQAGHR